MEGRNDDFLEALKIVGDTDLDRLTSFLEDDEVAPEAKLFAARLFSAEAEPPPSIGVCIICGAALQFEGYKDGLRVYCLGSARHHWKPTGEPLP